MLLVVLEAAPGEVDEDVGERRLERVQRAHPPRGDELLQARGVAGSCSRSRSRVPSSSTASTSGACVPTLSFSARGVSSATILPSARKATRAHSSSASCMSCVVRKIVAPPPASRLTVSRRSRADCGSRPRVGSSMNSTRGLLSSARASSRRWRMPVEKVLTLRLATLLRLTSSRTSAARPRQAVERAEELEVLLRRRALVDVGRLGDEVDLAADGLELARDLVAEDPRVAARRLRSAREDADHRRLAGAVVAEQPEDLARARAEAHAVERADVAVVLHEVRDLDREAGGRRERSRRRGGGGGIRARRLERMPRCPGPTRGAV